MEAGQRILVTGAAGFFGGWIVRELTAAGHRVTGLSRDELDLSDPAATAATVAASEPDVIVNAAGISSPRACEENPAACFTANTAATFNLLEAIRGRNRGTRLVLLSSATVYGPGAGDPLAETDPVAPHSIYASSKLAAEVLTSQYIREGKVNATTLRVFNLIGPGQPGDQAAAEFAAAVRDALEAGAGEVGITVGDPAISRDFTDVRDAARAVAAVIGVPGLFNLCSGHTASLLELADTLAGLARRHRDPAFSVHLDTDPERTSPGDARSVCGVPDKLRNATGWRPEIPLERSLSDLLFNQVEAGGRK